MRKLTADQVRQILCREIDEMFGGSQAEFAEAVGVSPPLINFFVKGRRPVSGKVLTHLGLEPVTMYRTAQRR